MKLQDHVRVFGRIPDHIREILEHAVSAVDLENPDSLTKEEAFFDACNRYDAETEFFNSEKNFYSGVLPKLDLTNILQPYYQYIFDTYLPGHLVFRSQVVRNIPGRIVHPHIDPRLYHRLSHRVHAVLKTNDSARHVYFLEENNYDTVYFKMEEGWIYDFDNITPHGAFNLGDTDRLHIITDIMPISSFDKYQHLIKDNPNFIPPGVFDEYYKHLGEINQKYGDKDGLRQHYLQHLENNEETQAINYPG